MLTTITIICMLLIIYHHVGYPLLLKKLITLPASEQTPVRQENTTSASNNSADYASIAVVIPAYNEQQYIAEKNT